MTPFVDSLKRLFKKVTIMLIHKMESELCTQYKMF